MSSISSSDDSEDEELLEGAVFDFLLGRWAPEALESEAESDASDDSEDESVRLRFSKELVLAGVGGACLDLFATWRSSSASLSDEDEEDEEEEEVDAARLCGRAGFDLTLRLGLDSESESDPEDDELLDESALLILSDALELELELELEDDEELSLVESWAKVARLTGSKSSSLSPGDKSASTVTPSFFKSLKNAFCVELRPCRLRKSLTKAKHL